MPFVLRCCNVSDICIGGSDVLVVMVDPADDLEENFHVKQRQLWFRKLDDFAQPLLHLGRAVAELGKKAVVVPQVYFKSDRFRKRSVSGSWKSRSAIV